MSSFVGSYKDLGFILSDMTAFGGFWLEEWNNPICFSRINGGYVGNKGREKSVSRKASWDLSTLIQKKNKMVLTRAEDIIERRESQVFKEIPLVLKLENSLRWDWKFLHVVRIYLGCLDFIQ